VEITRNSDEPQNLWPIFSQPWWLEAVVPGSWGDVTIEQAGEIQARLPYYLRKHRGLTMLTMPPLTQTLGPWLRHSSEKYSNQLSREKELMTGLIEKLPPFDFFQQNFHHSIQNWLPFNWAGFEQTTRYSYRIENLSDMDEVWEGFRKNIRTDIRKAQKTLEIRADRGLNDFINLNKMTFERQGLALPYSHELLARLDHACCERGCRKILVAQDGQGRLHAGIYLVWDAQAAYYLMGGSDPELRNSGATSLLVWEAIQFAAGVTRSFDFEGSMIESVERFFRAFGALQKPYFQVTKVNSLALRVWQDAKSWLRMWRGG
jgi:hypothetical protein